MPDNDNTQVPMETSTQQNTSITNPNTSLRVDGSSYIHKFDYKDVFKIIPEFDNTSAGCSIQTFIDEFESVKQFIPQCGEEFLVKMLRSKCRGEPLKRVTNAKIRTIDELAKFLRTHFKPDKDIDTWIKELNDFEQRQDEQIIDFNYRIGTHLQMTLAEIDLAETTDAQSLKSWAIKVAVKSFIAGLLPRYSLFLSKSKYNTLQEVVTEAMELEKRQKNIKNAENMYKPTIKASEEKACYTAQTVSSNAINRNKISNSRINGNRQNISSQANISNSNQQIDKYCRYCKRNNHVIDECRYLKNKNNGATIQNSNPNAKLQCNYCKKIGHIIRDCRKRAYNNSRREGGKTETNNVTNTQAGNARASPRIDATTGNSETQRQVAE
nr:uncharacterized protein LOC124220574 [Neodiprion pinetum]